MKNIGFPFDCENTYGHGKRFHFIRDSIEGYCKERRKNKKQIQILDIGCGTGIGLTFPIASLGYSIIGVDIDKDSIDWAKKENIYPNANFECGFLEKLTHLSDFDIIICSEVLEHVPNPKEFLTTLKNRLKPEGIIILTVPNGYGWFELEKFIVENLGLKYLYTILIKLRIIPVPRKPISFITLNKTDRHLHHFTYKKILKCFKETNLIVIKSSAAGLFGGPISETLFWWLKSWLKLNNLLGDLFPFLSLDWYFILKTEIKK